MARKGAAPKSHKPFIGVVGDVSHYGCDANSTIPRTGLVFRF
jgi:hypothetical protein